jgi:hypothetical protein
MSGTKTAVTAVVLTGAAALALWYATTIDPPIIIGDSSVFFSHDKIAANSTTEVESYKFFHKVRTITVKDGHNAASPPQSVPVDGRTWYLTSKTNLIRIELHPHNLGIGVAGKCPSPWQGNGTYFECADDQLSPSTLTFTDGQNCPIAGSTTPVCTLTCPSGYCRLELSYK